MTGVAIRMDDVSAIYRVREGLFRRRDFIALRDIELEIFSGETLGVVGANGSGKSTLLRLLAGIYQPDLGSIRFNVDKVSFLSLTLGFDPELSGADNAILSSMLLGATLTEARRLLPEIAEFSELGGQMKNPLKTYSSGMRSRLGFSVALFMQSDVLLIDEALAVGDAYFRNKSEQAITSKINTDQTVVLVSHSAQQICRLCDRAIWLDRGGIAAEGSPQEVTRLYQESILPVDT